MVGPEDKLHHDGASVMRALAQAHLKHQPQEISMLLTERRETTDEDLELIEMRYQQLLALVTLEDLFAEGQLDCL